MFGQPIMFNYVGEATEYKSTCGALVSLIINMVTLLYAVQLVIVLQGYRASTFTSHIIQNGIDKDKEFGVEDGFFFAVGLLNETNFTMSVEEMKDFIELRAQLETLDGATTEFID